MCDCAEFGGLTTCVCQGERSIDPERPLELWDGEGFSDEVLIVSQEEADADADWHFQELMWQ